MADTWGEILGGKRVIEKHFAKSVPLSATCPSLLYGVELEIENVPNWADMVVAGITAVHDGSLRNNGREFITSPMTYSNLAHCLGTFFQVNKLSEKNYSERCSIHVHTNCLNLTLDQIKTVLFLYQMCEKVLYSWVDPERYNNIFCVPWSQTNITHDSLTDSVSASTWKTWRKYTGLNLLPLYELGTIEWRHMSGHCDVKKILQWCQIIGAIYTYSLEHTFKEVKTQLLELNTNSQYQTMLERVFKDQAYLFYSIPTYAEDLEDGVLNLKYATNQTIFKPKKFYFTGDFVGQEAPHIEAFPIERNVVAVPRQAGLADPLVVRAMRARA